ncbi:MAG: hypothetical protein ACRES6_04375 [Steroidobacteraceae bacterium]
MTPDQAKAYCQRWNLIREREATELRRTSIEAKFRQLTALMASRDLFGPDPRREAEVQGVRDRWARLRGSLGG